MPVPVVAIGTSAGGQRALSELLSRMPADFPAATLIVSHLSPHFPSQLPELLGRVTPLPTRAAVSGELVRRGHVYLAVPDHHLMLAGDRLRLTRGPRENRCRPAVDVLFRSCAACLGPRSIGVVLTGALDDGTAGLWAIKDVNGQAIVQSPEEAEYPSMPTSAIKHVKVDRVTLLAEMPAVLLDAIAAADTRPERGPGGTRLQIETDIARGSDALKSGALDLGPSAPFTCPECGGPLSQIDEGPIRRFRCHTGHAFSKDTLLQATSEAVDQKLWQALRAMDERALLIEERLQSFRPDELGAAVESYQLEAAKTRSAAALVRGLLRNEIEAGQAAEGS